MVVRPVVVIVVVSGSKVFEFLIELEVIRANEVEELRWEGRSGVGHCFGGGVDKEGFRRVHLCGEEDIIFEDTGGGDWGGGGGGGIIG